MRTLTAGLSILALLALGGCVQFHTDIVVEKDGSGTMTMTFSMSSEVIEAMEAAQSMPGADQQDGPSVDMLERGEIEKLAAHYGVEVKEFEESEVEGRQVKKVVLAFDDINKAACMMTNMGDSSESIGLFRQADGDYALRSADMDCGEPPAELEEEETAAETPDMSEMDPAAMGQAMEAMGKMMAAMSELEIVMNITVPGDVISHNAHSVEGRTLTWTMNAENMMSSGGQMEPEIVFSGEGLDIESAIE